MLLSQITLLEEFGFFKTGIAQECVFCSLKRQQSHFTVISMFLFVYVPVQL